MKLEVVSVCAAAVILSLQGCGSSGGGGATTTTTTTSSGTTTPTTTSFNPTSSGTTTTTISSGTTATTTSFNPTPPDPMDGEAVAKIMNDEYNAFDENNDSSPIGVWFRYTPDLSELFYCDQPCYKGKPACKVSGSVMNYKTMITQQGTPSGWYAYTSAPLAGFYLNSSLVQKIGKCAYAWDGASDNKVNNGCGCPEPANPDKACTEGTKDFNISAYNNKVPPEYIKTTDADSSNVAPCACSALSEDNLPAYGIGDQCFYKGPAFDTSRDNNPNEFHKMMKRRIDFQNETRGSYGDAITAWNELNVDGYLLNEALMEDPAHTILAFVYSLHPGQSSLPIVQQLNAKFQKDRKLSKPLPIIKLDMDVDVRKGDASPWVFDPKDQLTGATMV